MALTTAVFGPQGAELNPFIVNMTFAYQGVSPNGQTNKNLMHSIL